MDSTQRIKPRDLVVGGRYLHRNGLFIREITEIDGNTVGYREEGKDHWCSKAVFVRQCPGVATPEAEAEARATGESRSLARLTDKGEFTVRDEANALTAFAFRNGPLEHLHSGQFSPLTDDPSLSRITDAEMKEIMINASEHLAAALETRESDPDKYRRFIQDYALRYCQRWVR